MSIYERYNLTEIINARGTFTPLGVSKSSPEVCNAVTDALSNYFIIDELQESASKAISAFAGSESATVTHCVASGITVSIAATMTGVDSERIASLPDSTNMPNCVVIPEGHCVNYGHPLEQAIRLAGAKPVTAGNKDACSLKDIEQEIAENNTCCLFLVSSKLVKSSNFDFTKAIEIAHKYNIPAIIDAAAQDFRIKELIKTGADLVLLSAQKYLTAPTAGLVIGTKSLVDAVKAQKKGIGRGMKTTKESIIGVLAAIEQREKLLLPEWRELHNKKTSRFIEQANKIPGINARAEADVTGLPFSRVLITIVENKKALNAETLAIAIKSGSPSIWVMDQNIKEDEIGLELVQVTNTEIESILTKLSGLLN